jgi:dihydroorotase
VGVPDRGSRVLIEIPRPDDWHVHLRDGDMLRAVLPSSSVFGRVLAMPNTVPPIAKAADGRRYLERVRAVAASRPTVHLAAYLTDRTDPDDLVSGFSDGTFLAAKLYPAGATTHSDAGVTDLAALRSVFSRMAQAGMPLCVHGEVTDPTVDVFDREQVFLDSVLEPLVEAFPTLRVVVEHATTRAAVAFVRRHAPRVAATITPHHLWWNRNALFAGGLRPHAYCLPVLKREEDRLALVEAATSGEPSFIAGTDSAPHPIHLKEMDCGCAGVFNAPTALAAYATVFDHAGALDHLASFVSRHGAGFYGLPPAEERVRIERRPWTPPRTVPCPGGEIRVFLGGEPLDFRVD